MLMRQYHPFHLVEKFFDEHVKKEDHFIPRANIREERDAYHIELDIPGVDKKDVRVEVKENYLTIRGERKEESKEHAEDYHLRESFCGRFERSWILNENVNVDRIEAVAKDGVYRIVLPKKAEVKKREEVKQITIQ